MAQHFDDGNPIGELLDRLGIVVPLRDGQQVVEAIVIPLTKDVEQGTTSIAVARSEGLDWVTQLGMLHAALNLLTEPDSE